MCGNNMVCSNSSQKETTRMYVRWELLDAVCFRCSSTSPRPSSTLFQIQDLKTAMEGRELRTVDRI